ncbi:hypothetical protein [Cellulophaga sp. L1A9]|uniref:hypothetical protein n=1 Tax=Cellulophaga sp. L1A9 TaxID=2686362 RepID=UPI00131D9657|nr:hypothetical protein [Cellulophaga sp. L1A9]
MRDSKINTSQQKNLLTNRNYLIKLERYSKELDQLDVKLNSYTCEPKTEYLFERKSLLKQQMYRLKKTNQEIIETVRERKELLENQIDRIKTQLDDFITLQSEFHAYYSRAQQH